MIRKYKGTIVKREKLAPDVDLFSVELEGLMAFQPGQFAMVYVEDDPKEMRAFSLCSLPNGRVVEFCIKLYAGGKFSPKIFQKQVGDVLTVKGPYGLFTLADVNEDIVLIAGGTGIAPIRSMLLEHQRDHKDQMVWLFYRFKNREGFLFRKELERLGRGANVKVVPTVSNPDASWDGEVERVHKIIGKYVPDLKKKYVYICGPPKMVDTTIGELVKLGCEKERIHREVW